MRAAMRSTASVKRDVVHLLQEGEDVAALAAAEAVVEADLRAHVEARAALVVERAEALQRADAGALQRHVVADDVGDVDARPDLVDVASANEAGHALILRYSARRCCGAPAPRDVHAAVPRWEGVGLPLSRSATIIKES